MEEVTLTFTEIMTRATIALEAAIKDYGPDAVDLALTVYRVEGIKGTIGAVISLLFAIGIIYGTIRMWSFCIKLYKEHDEEPALLFAGLVTCLSVMGFILCASICIGNAYHIAAAFGYPEILIVSKALSAAGLL